MLILRHLLTLLLALQIVNPMCKCDGIAGNSTCKSSDSAPPLGQHACCSEMMDMAGMEHSKGMQKAQPSEKDNNTHQNKHLCMCLKDPNVSQDTKVALPDGPQLIDLPQLAIIELPDPIKDQPLMLPPVRDEKHPPGPDIQVLFSTFLI